MSKQDNRTCDNCFVSITSLDWGYWQLKKVHTHRTYNYSKPMSVIDISEPHELWDFCSVECLMAKVQEEEK